jgi:hypothetical protein
LNVSRAQKQWRISCTGILLTKGEAQVLSRTVFITFWLDGKEEK